MSKYSGLAVYNYVFRLFINLLGYTHYPQFIKNLQSYAQFGFFNEHQMNSFMHSKFIQFVSVNEQFYTLCTVPTITTTNNK